MFLSFFLIFIFLFMALLQIYFLGKLFSITQSTFVNQQPTILASGFLLYMFFTFLSLIPLYFFNAPQSFIYAMLIIKDIFIILFLISRRDLFQKHKINFIEYAIIFLISALIVISFRYLYHYVNKNVITANQNSNNYFLLNKIINFIKMITLSEQKIAIL